MTAQEVFDTVVAHLRKQGVRSIDENGKCLYRGPNDTKCAVGCLIPNESYHPAFETMSSGWVIRQPGLARLKQHKVLLGVLQIVHDYHDIWRWETSFQETAKEFNLQYTPVMT